MARRPGVAGGGRDKSYVIERRLEDFGQLSPAEELIRDRIGAGGFVIIGDGALPGAAAAADRQVRAGFIRYLTTGGCKALPAPVPETGVQVEGALVTGTLDLEGVAAERDLALFNCRFAAAPVMR